MYRRFLSSKIHGAWVTHADVAYEGSVTISPELLEAAGMRAHESVEIWNVTNGNRLQTYIIEGRQGSTDLAINGAAAHLMQPGDQVIIANFLYCDAEEAVSHEPTVVFVDDMNRVKEVRGEVAGPKLVANK